MLIGFSGFARAGKDTAGRFLEEHYGFRRAHFAAFLKRLVGELFDFDEAQLYGARKESPDPRYPLGGLCPSCGDGCIGVSGASRHCPRCAMTYPSHLTPRLALQVIGVASRRLHSGVWVEATMRGIAPGEHVAICDVRFPNEVRAIQSRGGRVVRLTRGEPQSAHASETALANRPELFDHIIDNHGSVGALHARLEQLMATYGLDRAA